MLALAGATLLACTGPDPGGLQNFGDLQRRIISFYRDRAWERNATCLTPEMLGINRITVLEETPERLILDVRYTWNDPNFGRNPTRSFGGRVSTTCFGSGDRQFVVARGADETHTVLSMTGPQRGR